MKRTIEVLSVFLLVGLMCLPGSGVAQSVDDLVIITENYPPYSFRQDGKLQGIGVDLMVAMLEQFGSKQNRNSIRFLPWARGYQLVLKKRGTCLFSTTRTEEREHLFKWVGPIAPTTVSLIGRKDKNLKIRSAEDLRKYRVGAVIDDVGEQLLRKTGFDVKSLDRIGGTNVTLLSIKKLNLGRIDVWAYEENVAKWEIKAKGFNPDDYETVYVLGRGDLYYAFHKDTAAALISRFQTALDEIKQTNRYQQILDRYLK